MTPQALDPINQLYTEKPLVLGHRGASRYAPQNTLAAFTLAGQMGADGVELDTSLTRDGIPVVIHDLSLDKTTNGSGPVRALDLKAIKELDAGSRFSPDFKDERIPTLDEVFETLGPDMIVNVELKSNSWPPNGLEPAVLAVIRRHRGGPNPRVIMSSFNPFALRRFRALAPDLPIGYLYAPQEPIYLRQRWLMIGCPYDAIHPMYTMISPESVVQAHARGWRVNTWTVDDAEQIRKLRGWGVDAIISNCPDVALTALGRKPER